MGTTYFSEHQSASDDVGNHGCWGWGEHCMFPYINPQTVSIAQFDQLKHYIYILDLEIYQDVDYTFGTVIYVANDPFYFLSVVYIYMHKVGCIIY